MSMRKYLKDRAGRPDEVLHAYVTVELSAGTAHKGYGAAIDVEVEFTQTPIVRCSSFCRIEDAFPDEGGERDLVSIRPIKSMGGKVEYLDCPDWLSKMLARCIDLDVLDAREG